MTGAELADEIERVFEASRSAHEAYAASKGDSNAAALADESWKTLTRAMVRHKSAILAALRAERPEPAVGDVIAFANEHGLGGFSWNGHIVCGDKASIDAAVTAVHEAGTIPALRAARIAALSRPQADEGAVPTPGEYRELLDACWAINDRLRITPGMEAIFTGSTNDIDVFRDMLHALEPAYRSAALAALRPADPGPGVEEARQIVAAYEAAMAGAATADHKLAVMANYGDLALQLLPTLAAPPPRARRLPRAEVEREIVTFMETRAKQLRGGPLGGEVEATMAEDFASAIERGDHRTALVQTET